ncbi:MAG: hypothetical protein HYU58_16030 [Proteobacteria bacterium]|nr:hypothetical protein [Pseudomonadota bacterium]
MHRRRKGLAILLTASFLLGSGTALAEEKERLFGAWCDDTGYRIDIGPEAIRFRDRQMGDPPSGTNLVVKNGIATYAQDFRKSAWPHIGLLSCTLRLLGDNAAAETCSGDGYGFMPFFALKRCPKEVIS